MAIDNVRSVPQWGGADMRYGHVPRPCEAGRQRNRQGSGRLGKIM